MSGSGRSQVMVEMAMIIFFVSLFLSFGCSKEDNMSRAKKLVYFELPTREQEPMFYNVAWASENSDGFGIRVAARDCKSQDIQCLLGIYAEDGNKLVSLMRDACDPFYRLADSADFVTYHMFVDPRFEAELVQILTNCGLNFELHPLEG